MATVLKEVEVMTGDHSQSPTTTRIRTEINEGTPASTPRRTLRSVARRLALKSPVRSTVPENSTQVGTQENEGSTQRGEETAECAQLDAEAMQVILDMLLNLQGNSSQKYHLLRETQSSNGQIRMSVLFSPTILFQSTRLRNNNELRETLVRYSLAARYETPSRQRNRPSNTVEVSRTNTREKRQVPDTVGFGDDVDDIFQALEQVISRRPIEAIEAERGWSKLQRDELRDQLKTPEDGFKIPYWMGMNSSDTYAALKSKSETLQASRECARKFDSLNNKEIVWMYRKVFFALYSKVKEIDFQLLGMHMKYEDLTPPWLRTKIKVERKIVYLQHPVLPQLRDVRNENSNQALRWILAAFYKREETFAKATLEKILSKMPPLSLIENDLSSIRRKKGQSIGASASNSVTPIITPRKRVNATRSGSGVIYRAHKRRKRNLDPYSPASVPWPATVPQRQRPSRPIDLSMTILETDHEHVPETPEQPARTTAPRKPAPRTTASEHRNEQSRPQRIFASNEKRKESSGKGKGKTNENKIMCGYGGQYRFKDDPTMQAAASFSRRCVTCNVSMHDMCAFGEDASRTCPKC